MTEEEKKLANLLKFIEEERKHTGNPGHPYHEGAVLVLNLVQKKTELVLEKLKEIRTNATTEEAFSVSDWIYKLMRYLIGLNGLAVAEEKKNRRSIFVRSSHAYTDGIKGEARKSFTEFESVFAFEGDLKGVETHSEFLKLMNSKTAEELNSIERTRTQTQAAAKDVERI